MARKQAPQGAVLNPHVRKYLITMQRLDNDFSVVTKKTDKQYEFYSLATVYLYNRDINIGRCYVEFHNEDFAYDEEELPNLNRHLHSDLNTGRRNPLYAMEILMEQFLSNYIIDKEE